LSALSGKGRELAIFMIDVTNPMQSGVENGVFVVEYAQRGHATRTSAIRHGN